MPRRPTRYFPDVAPHLPNYGADWRWKRAEEIVNTGKHVSIPRDGAEIARAVAHIRALNHGGVGRWAETLKSDQVLTDAVRFRRDGWFRPLELHCRILAKQSVAVTAIEMGLSQPVIATYCRFFFDVGHRLECNSFVYHRVIGLDPLRPPSVESLMMLSAYKRGPHIIDQWIDWWPHQGEAHDLATAEGRVRESIELFVAAQQLPTDERTQRSLWKTAHYTLKASQNSFRTRSPHEIVGDNVSEMLNTVVWGNADRVTADATADTANGYEAAPIARELQAV